jgi:hypothetical protein
VPRALGRRLGLDHAAVREAVLEHEHVRSPRQRQIILPCGPPATDGYAGCPSETELSLCGRAVRSIATKVGERGCQGSASSLKGVNLGLVEDIPVFLGPSGRGTGRESREKASDGGESVRRRPVVGGRVCGGGKWEAFWRILALHISVLTSLKWALLASKG